MIPSTMAGYALRARAAGARIIGKTSSKITHLITPAISGKNENGITEVNWKLLRIDDEMKRVIGYLDSPWFRQGHRNQYIKAHQTS